MLVNHRLAIDKDLEVADRLDIEEHLACLLWTEHCLIDSRELGEIDPRSKLMLTEGCLVDWISMLACCHWLAFPLHVVPEGAAEAFLAIDATLVVIRSEHLVTHEMTALE